MKRIGIQIAAFCGLLTGSWPAWASEGGGKKILPQLDVTLFPGVLFWAVTSFVALYIIMSFVGLPGIKKTIAKRQRLLDADLEAARLANEEAQSVIRSYESDLLEARHRAQDTVGGIVAEATALAMKHREKQEQELKHRMVVAHQNIAQAKADALKDTQQYVNDLVQEIVGRVMQAGIVAGADKARS